MTPERLLEDRVRLWRRLPPELRSRLATRAGEFLRRVPFTPAGGLEIDDTMRWVIAAQACLVTLGYPDDGYEALHGITLHPDEFVVEESV
jgi:Mlc titration factor MtfA (ptsG expression regulator)